MAGSSPDNRDARTTLLGGTDLPPVQIINPRGRSSFLLIGDHAGTMIPAALGTLGLAPADLCRHIAVDIGVQQLGEALSTRLDATFICQRYSRLVIDCNRAPFSPEAIPDSSDGTVISYNAAINAVDSAQRVAEIHAPYQAAIDQLLRERDAAKIETILISLHSFTPILGKVKRPWDVGVLHGSGNIRFAVALLGELESNSNLAVGDNEPYRMDSTDYTVPLHAFPTGRSYVELEVRQDHLLRQQDIEAWSERLASAFTRACVTP